MVLNTYSRWWLAATLCVALALHLWGVRRDLPYINDDPVFVNAAVRIAASGDLNPRWFGHPGSTLIYPMAAAFHAWHALAFNGSWLRPDPRLREAVDTQAHEFHLIGRLVTVAYAVGSVALTFEVGRWGFSNTTGLVGAGLAALYPTDVFAKRVRTDSASVFFCMLALWQALRLLRHPTLPGHVAAGAAVGFAIGTKYSLGVVLVALAAVEVTLCWRQRSTPGGLRRVLPGVAAALGAVPMGFFLSTPYFFLDHATAIEGLRVELRSGHLGADGLSPLQNVAYYLLDALPAVVPWPQLILLVVGLVRLLRTPRTEQMVLALFAATFLAGISTSALHWARWILPILPVLALFVASGLELAITQLHTRWHLSGPRHGTAWAVGIVLLVAAPLREVVAIDRRATRPSTMVLTRRWLEANLPAGSRVAFESDALPPPLRRRVLGRGFWTNHTARGEFHELAMSRLCKRGSLETYVREGFPYLVTNGSFFATFMADPVQFPTESAFYRSLFEHGRLLHTEVPTGNEGSEIRIYEVR